MNACKTIMVIGCLLVFMAFHAPAEAETLLSVQVKEAQLRSVPSFLGKIVTTVAYAGQVEVVGEKGDWKNVAVPETSTKGWMHSSALTKKTIILKAGKKDIEKFASSDEIALAGKGFNQEVENAYKKGNSSVNYDAVDQMEKIVVSQPEMEQFLTAGDVSP
ncbi:MAG: SH3 domain-containing protein, partial [bacterium]|nr:SH3 domain-containing protein [bacterium]